MESLDPEMIVRALDFEACACELVWNGENLTYRISTEDDEYALRIYRQNRRTKGAIEAEWNWAKLLGPEIQTPQAIPATDGSIVRSIAGHHTVCMTWINGQKVSLADSEALEEIGKLVGKLQRRSQYLTLSHEPLWLRRDRPFVDPTRTIRESVGALEDSKLLEPHQVKRLRALSNELMDRLRTTPLTPNAFLHGDLHVGNLVLADDGLVVLDLDDCMWGPAEMEWAQLRIHLRAQNLIASAWPVLLENSKLDHSINAIRLATALYVIHIMATFSNHLDMDAFTNPQAVVERYLGYLESELTE